MRRNPKRAITAPDIQRESENNADGTEDAKKSGNIDETFDNYIYTNISSSSQSKAFSPTKIKCPFDSTDDNELYSQIDNYFSDINFCSQTQFPRMFSCKIASLPEPERSNASEFIQNKINSELNNNHIFEFCESPIISDFNSKIEKLEGNIKVFCSIFRPICRKIDKIISLKIREILLENHFQFLKDVAENIASDVVKEENINIAKSILRFYSNFKLFVAEINDKLVSTIIGSFEPYLKKDKKTLFTKTVNTFSLMIKILPIGEISLTTSLTQLYLKEILKTDINSFILQIAPIITQLFDDLFNFVNSTEDIDTTIGSFVHFYEKTKFDLEDSLTNYRLFKSFPNDIKMLIGNTLKKCITKNNEQIAIRFAELIDQAFRQGNHDNINFSQEAFLIRNIESFEAAHAGLMLKRALEVSMSPDQQFVKEYKKIYGFSSVARFESILADYNDGHKMVSEFTTSAQYVEIPKFLHIFTFYSCNWGTVYRSTGPSITFPKIVSPFLENFKKFYEHKIIRKRIEWNGQLTNCELVINNIKVKCNGVYATILYSISESPKSLEEISNETSIDSAKIESLLTKLTSKKFDNFVEFNNKKHVYSINSEAETGGNSIVLPVFMADDNEMEAKRQKIMLMSSQSTIVDSAILGALKRRHTMKEAELFEETQKRCRFTLDFYCFEDEIRALEKKRYIKHDHESNSIVFIP